jgi:hypothetical protein
MIWILNRPNIQFAMETESNGHLSFLNIVMHRRPAGTLGNTVDRKPPHINLYLKAESHHYPANKHSVLSTLVHRARAICDQESLPEGEM